MSQIVDLAEGVPPAVTSSRNVDHFVVENKCGAEM